MLGEARNEEHYQYLPIRRELLRMFAEEAVRHEVTVADVVSDVLANNAEPRFAQRLVQFIRTSALPRAHVMRLAAIIIDPYAPMTLEEISDVLLAHSRHGTTSHPQAVEIEKFVKRYTREVSRTMKRLKQVLALAQSLDDQEGAPIHA